MITRILIFATVLAALIAGVIRADLLAQLVPFPP